jgi:hypothetical protein
MVNFQIYKSKRATATDAFQTRHWQWRVCLLYIQNAHMHLRIVEERGKKKEKERKRREEKKREKKRKREIGRKRKREIERQRKREKEKREDEKRRKKKRTSAVYYWILQLKVNFIYLKN